MTGKTWQWALACVLSLAPAALAATSAQDIVIHAGSVAPADIHGNWQKVADASAAGGLRMRNPDAGAAKIAPALVSPANYFEIKFQALANVPYRLWVRQKADVDSVSNDSIYLQFDHTINYTGASVYRIGTTSSAEVVLEEVSGRLVQGWGWQDNGWGPRITGDVVMFDTSGTQTVRIQQREDGVSVDQIVLSPTASSYFCTSPGVMKNDTTILAAQGPTADIVLYPAEAPVKVGPWSVVSDATAAGGTALKETDNGLAKLATPLASPASYFEMTFQAQAGVEYHLWMRMKAPNTASDSVHVQFDHTVNTSGAPAYRIGTGGATGMSLEVVLENGSGNGISNWGWRDSKWGTTTPETRVKFDTSGTQTIRCQRREDGPTIDQIMLSPATYLTTNPGLEKNDNTIRPKSVGLAPPLDKSLRILEANQHKCRSTAEVYDPQRTASEMAIMNANIIGVNEVLSSQNHPTLVQDALSRKTGVQWNVYFIPDVSGGTEGSMILSMFPIAGTEQRRTLPYSAGAGRVQVDVYGKLVNFLVTHLAHETDATGVTKRTAQVADLVSWMSTFAEPRLVVGDFNANPGTSELSGMGPGYYDGWSKAVTAGTATAYPDNPVSQTTRTRKGRLDYVWYSKNATNLVLVNSSVPDMRDKGTYSTSGATNAIGDFIAIGLWTGTSPVTMQLDTHDDKGIRASDHNWLTMKFNVN